jgi:ABC-type multidrug transport system permease subunit
MYNPTTYFLGRFISHFILQLFYPVTFVLVVFWGIDIDTSIENFFLFVLFAMLLNMVNVAQGYFCGILTDNEQAAQQINTFAILLFMLTSGGLGNVDAFPAFIKYFSYISPQRYACQGFLYRIT